jgi:4-aminobutyrate aminotransferase-like enzyme
VGAPLGSTLVNERFNSAWNKPYVPARSTDCGAYCNERLKELRRYDLVGDMRGMGLRAAVEFVTSRETMEMLNAPKYMRALMTTAFVRASGNFGSRKDLSTTRCPALCLSTEAKLFS